MQGRAESSGLAALVAAACAGLRRSYRASVGSEPQLPPAKRELSRQ